MDSPIKQNANTYHRSRVYVIALKGKHTVFPLRRLVYCKNKKAHAGAFPLSASGPKRPKFGSGTAPHTRTQFIPPFRKGWFSWNLSDCGSHRYCQVVFVVWVFYLESAETISIALQIKSENDRLYEDWIFRWCCFRIWSWYRSSSWVLFHTSPKPSSSG